MRSTRLPFSALLTRLSSYFSSSLCVQESLNYSSFFLLFFSLISVRSLELFGVVPPFRIFFLPLSSLFPSSLAVSTLNLFDNRSSYPSNSFAKDVVSLTDERWLLLNAPFFLPPFLFLSSPLFCRSYWPLTLSNWQFLLAVRLSLVFHPEKGNPELALPQFGNLPTASYLFPAFPSPSFDLTNCALFYPLPPPFF